MYLFNRSTNIEQYSIVGKFGMSYASNNYIIGLTLLTPRLKLLGNGSYNYEEFHSGTEYSLNEDIYTTSSQSGLKTDYRSAWAVGLGVTIPVRKSKIHLSGEWYGDIPRYTLVQATPHESQSHGGDTINLKVIDELHGVVNFGVGIEYYINEKVSGYLSMSSDFSAVTSDIDRFVTNSDEVSNSIFQANYYHFGGGVVLHIKRADITLGATYTGATQDFDRPINFPDDPGDEIFGSNDKAQLEWDRARIVFSFSVPFIKEVQEKVEDKLGF
jgi:hypothetical protein